MIWGSSPGNGWNCSLRHRVQTGSRADPASYIMGNRGSFFGVNRPGGEADYSPPSSAEVKNSWSCTSIPHTPSRRGAQLKQHRNNFTFNFYPIYLYLIYRKKWMYNYIMSFECACISLWEETRLCYTMSTSLLTSPHITCETVNRLSLNLGWTPCY
jgi:hypothetical protein